MTCVRASPRCYKATAGGNSRCDLSPERPLHFSEKVLPILHGLGTDSYLVVKKQQSMDAMLLYLGRWWPPVGGAHRAGQASRSLLSETEWELVVRGSLVARIGWGSLLHPGTLPGCLSPGRGVGAAHVHSILPPASHVGDTKHGMMKFREDRSLLGLGLPSGGFHDRYFILNSSCLRLYKEIRVSDPNGSCPAMSTGTQVCSHTHSLTSARVCQWEHPRRGVLGWHSGGGEL